MVLSKRILTAVCSLLYSIPAWAIPVGQVYCTNTPLPGMQTGIMFSFAQRNCGGKTDLMENLCSITATCVIADAAFRARVRSQYGQDFDQLDSRGKTAAITLDQGIEKYPSNVTCFGEVSNGVGVCPLLDKCKDRLEVLMKPNMGTMDQAKIHQRETDPVTGGIQYVPVSGDMTPAKGN